MSFNNRIIFLYLTSFIYFFLNCDEPKADQLVQQKSIFNRSKKPKKIRKEFKELTFEELEFNKNVQLKINDKEGAIRYVERMISICKDQAKICELRLELGELYYDISMFDRSFLLYNEFVRSYPGNANAEYVSYKAILSLFNKSSIPERDQAETKEAIKLAKEFLNKESIKKENKNIKYKKQVESILEQCNKKLLDSEINVFNFYLKKKKFKAAQLRLDYIKDNFLKDPKEDNENTLLSELEEQLKAAQEKRKYVPSYQKQNSFNVFSKKQKKRSYGDRF